MKVITLCGSTQFEDTYRKINEKLTLEGNVVFSCGVFSKGKLRGDQIELLQDIHRQKIDMSNEIFIINVGGYTGKHTDEEIEYAKKTGKKIRYFENEKRN